MALVTERVVNHRDGALTLDVTYDDATLDLEEIRVECHAPYPCRVAIWRSDRTSSPWREATLTDGDVIAATRPIGGGFRKLDQLLGMGYAVEFGAG